MICIYKMSCILKEKYETPVEDLSSEHGLLNRILLIYDEFINRYRIGKKIALKDVNEMARIVRDFIENYHEKNEEKYIFPVVMRCKELRPMVKELLKQHRVGRKYTSNILKYSESVKGGDMKKMVENIEKFTYMYRAHESREDTVIFRAFHMLSKEGNYKKLGKKMENVEEEKFGGKDYNDFLLKIIKVEKRLGIYKLEHYT